MEFPISYEESKECYGKPCACLACRHEDYFCVIVDNSSHPCNVCDGKDEDITNSFCIPDNEDIEEFVNEIN